jgi:1,4-dihydroxy-2-naphthoate octaprenyltransferase
MPPTEPTPATLRQPVLRYLFATRLPFLSVTLVGCLLGLGSAHASGVALNGVLASVTIVLALLTHAGVNVLNDYYDALNGTDAINTERVFPFTGGSRMIQNGVLSAQSMARYGVALLVPVVVGGLWLVARTGPGLVVIGLAGLVIGWAYSAPPLKLNSRGGGELAVAAGFTLIVLGTDYVQRGSFSSLPLIAAVPYALLVTNILYLNQFPDRAADAAVGKRHWVVRLPVQQARWGYLAVGLAAYGWLLIAVLLGVLPARSLVALAAALPSALATRQLLRHAAEPQALAPAIRLTIAAALLHGLLLAGALLLVSQETPFRCSATTNMSARLSLIPVFRS